jgi:hypothetical protein
MKSASTLFTVYPCNMLTYEALRLSRAKAMKNEGFGQYTEAATEKEVLDFTTSVQP